MQFAPKKRLPASVLKHLRDHQLKLEAIAAALRARAHEDPAELADECTENGPKGPETECTTEHGKLLTACSLACPTGASLESQDLDPATDPAERLLYQLDVEHLDAPQQTELRELLRDYKACLSISKDDVGTVPDDYKDYFLKIPTDPGAKCQQRPYKLSQTEREEFARQIDNLQQRGVIAKAEGPTDFVSPVLFVPKPHNKQELRMCVDFRMLNRRSKRDYHALPVVTDLQQQMAGSRFITTLDLTSGFWALPIAQEDRHKTAFTGPDGEVYVWHKAPMGLANSPAAFQRLMAHVLAGIPNVSVYIDDITIYTDSWEKHVAILARVMERLKEAGLKVKTTKCHWARPEARVLGSIVSERGVSPDPEKTQAIDQLPVPRNVADVRSFLGATGYFHAHIPRYAEISEPLRQLLKKGATFEWDDACQTAFRQLKDELKSERCLRMPDWQRPFILTTDWSKIAVGAVLSQILPINPRYPEDGEAEFALAFASRALTPAESHYAPTEGECLALVWAVKKFRQYLHGCPFTLRTDHAALQWLQSARMENSKLERWALRLQEFDYTVEHIKGEHNTIADHLSRHFPHFHAHALHVASGHLAYALSRRAVDVHEDGGDVDNAADWQRVDLRKLWEQGALEDIEAQPCTICGNSEGDNTMVICDACERPYHLQCCFPPRTDVPPGDWYCHECCEIADCVSEMQQRDTPVLFARPRDPFWPEIEGLVRDYVHYRQRAETAGLRVDQIRTPSIMSELEEQAYKACPFDVPKPLRQHVKRIAKHLRPHPRLPGWYTQRVLLRTGELLRLTVPPLRFRWALIAAHHDRLGHAGVSQTFARMHRHFHWPGMKADVAGVISACHACQVKLLITEEPAEVERARMSGPLQHVHIDLAGPFKWVPSVTEQKTKRPSSSAKSALQKGYVVLMVDYFTKAAEFCCIPDKSSASVARAFHDCWLMRWGAPQLLTSDNGLEFAGAFRHLLERFSIEAMHTSVRHPQSNGAVERLVQTLKSSIAAVASSTTLDWPKLLPKIRMDYMQRVHRSTKRSPNELLLASRPALPPPVGDLICQANSVRATPSVSESEQLTAFLRERDERHARILQGVTEELINAQTANVRDQTKRLLAKRAGRRGGSKPLTIGDLAYVVEASNKGFKATVLGPYVVVGLGEKSGLGRDTVRLRTSNATSRSPVEFDRHRNQVARATTVVDVLEKLLKDAHVELPPVTPVSPDRLLETHVASGPLPDVPSQSAEPASPAAPSGGL